MNWTRLEKPQLAVFLAHVKTADTLPLFGQHYVEGRSLPLPFFHTMRLYRLTNFASMPILELHYLSDGNRAYYLDGTETPLVTLGQMGDLKLTAGNVIAYLHFYFFAVVMNEGEVFLVKDPTSYPFQDDGGADFTPQFSFAPGGPAYTITADENGGFVVDTPLFIDGTMAQAQVAVSAQGAVKILNYRMMAGAGAGVSHTTQPTTDYTR